MRPKAKHKAWQIDVHDGYTFTQHDWKKIHRNHRLFYERLLSKAALWSYRRRRSYLR